MSRLIGVELRRLASRRGVLALTALAIVLAYAFAATTSWHTRPPSAQEIADARAQAAIAAKDHDTQSQYKACLESPADYLGPNSTASDCKDVLPSVDSYLPRPTLSAKGALDNDTFNLAVVLGALLVVLGATYAGGDWSTGSMTNQLLFEARRSRVFSAKACAVAIWSFATGTVSLAIAWVTLAVVLNNRGIDLPGELVGHIGWSLARMALLLTLAGVVGYAFTMLTRSTIATLAVVFGISVGSEALLGLLPGSGLLRLSPINNITAWFLGEAQYFDPTISCTGCSKVDTIQMWTGLGYCLVVSAIAVLLAWVTFRRRDIP